MAEDNQLSGFAKLADNLKEQNETAKTIDENRIFAEKIQSQLLDDSIKLSQDQRKELIQLQEILTGNELKTLEDKKEANAIAEQTLEALEGILENTEDLGKIDGPEEGGLLALLAIPVALIGLGAGFVVGIAESLAKLIKIIGKGLLKAVTPIVKGVLGLFKTLFVGVFKLLNKIPFVKSLTSSIRGFFSNLGGQVTKAGKAIGQAFKPLTNGIKNIKSALSGFTKVGKDIGQAFKSLSNGIKNIKGAIGQAFKPLTNGIKNIKSAFAAGFSGLKSFTAASGQFAKLGKIGNIGKGIAQGLKNISNAVASIMKWVIEPFKQISKDLAPIKKLMPSGKSLMPKSGIKGIGKLITTMKSIFKAAFSFGRVLGRLFYPITILISVFDTLKGALSGFDKYKDKGFLEGIIGGLFGGLSGFLTGFIGMPLDLLKDAISWIASKLGFKNFSKQLDSFSFSEMIGKLFTSITDTVIEFIGTFTKYSDKGFLEGIIGGLFGGLAAYFIYLIGLPLDILKKAVSWIASKLGFENFSGFLDSFSFSEMITKVFTSITDTIVEFIGSIKESIADIGIGGLIKNVALNLLKIFKKIVTFPSAVAAGAMGAIANLFGDPMEGFQDAFNKVFTMGDSAIDSMKVQGDGLNEKGEEIQVMSGENELEKTNQAGKAAAAQNIISSTDNRKNSSTFISQKPAPPDRTAMGVSSR
jgi:hypothetical protein